jgi:hypothetical protein
MDRKAVLPPNPYVATIEWGQAKLLAALCAEFNRPKNPLRILRDKVNPEWISAERQLRRSRGTIGTGGFGNYGDESNLAIRNRMLEEWAVECGLREPIQSSPVPARWMVNWAIAQFPLTLDWEPPSPLLEANASADRWKRIAAQPPPTPPPAIFVSCGECCFMVKVPLGAKPGDVNRACQKAWELAKKALKTQAMAAKKSSRGPRGRPPSASDLCFQCAALRLCRVYRKPGMKPNTFTQYATRGAKAAGIDWPPFRKVIR